MDNIDTCNLRVPNEEDLNNVLRSYTDDPNNEIRMYSDSLYILTDKVHGIISKNTANFSIFSINLQSLNSKFDSLLATLSDLDDKNLNFHAICIQKTWLSKDCDTSLFAIPGYHLVHHSLG